MLGCKAKRLSVFITNKAATAVKTGYTRASGFSGAMIAEKRSDRIIVVIFGGKSTKTRNAQMIKLAELGFRKLEE